VEESEGNGLNGGYLLAAASCGWKAWGTAVLNGKGVFIWGESGIDLGGIRQLGKWYRLEIKAIGDNISLYIDDKLVLEREDNFNPSGGASLWAFDSIVEFDNIIITGDGIPNVGPSGYAVEPKAKLSTTWGAVKR
jgi:hypothetical protein